MTRSDRDELLALAARILSAETRAAGDIISGGIRERLGAMRRNDIHRAVDTMRVSIRRAAAKKESSDDE